MGIPGKLARVSEGMHGATMNDAMNLSESFTPLGEAHPAVRLQRAFCGLISLHSDTSYRPKRNRAPEGPRWLHVLSAEVRGASVNFTLRVFRGHLALKCLILEIGKEIAG
jgi:hypothetical protein